MNEIKNTNSKVILFSTWARKEGNDYYKKSGLTYTQALSTIQNNYYNFAKKHNTSVIYTGTLFFKANKLNINTYDSDGSHPNMVGSYIVALAFLKNLFPETKVSCDDITQIVAINKSTCESVNNIF